ncbi:hypothetical protein [Sulfurimonas sp.]|uniref:hypothetical protein n=1 Tax=Sulfurimonas sp. TaxID=2022749 RepID=UPI002B47B263|nr:hypothetical protein [Sulfurimonas sp.]
MFGNILGKIKGKKSEDKVHSELVQKISKMNLTDMKAYINNRIPDLSVDEVGLSEIMKKLIKVDEKTSKRYIDASDMDTKIKKGFELVLTLLVNKKITVLAIEQVGEFIKIYKEIINDYDKKHKQIYGSRFNKALGQAVDGINLRAELNRKSNVIGE